MEGQIVASVVVTVQLAPVEKPSVVNARPSQNLPVDFRQQRRDARHLCAPLSLSHLVHALAGRELGAEDDGADHEDGS